jgi:ABC-type polysaccharide/polyol phosphate transport system ATPase subunit
MQAIEVVGVHKTFRIPHEVHTTLTERMLSLFRPVSYERFEALRGVDLEIEKGTFTGIIGGNGSGKSTLLKIISGLLLPDRGSVHVHGTMSALLELGLGFSPELTVQENVELYAAVLGYPRREVKRRVEEAIDFAGLERFRDAKLKNLSTGMRARLGFSTALQAESDIMLLDEILAVGDADFQRKCLKVFDDFKRRKRTIILVTHDLAQVQRLCDNAVLLESGKIVASGTPPGVVKRYMQSVLDSPSAEARAGWRGDGRMRVVEGWLENDAGERVGRLRSGERATLVVRFVAYDDLDEPVVGMAITAADGTMVYSINTNWLEVDTPSVPKGGSLEMRAAFSAALFNGYYSIQAGAMSKKMELHDLRYELLEFAVHGSASQHGTADLGAEIRSRVLSTSANAEVDDEPSPIRAKGGLL